MAADGDAQDLAFLTPRQRELLERVCLGRRNGQITHNLDLSFHTMNAHLHNDFQWPGVETRAAAAAVYWRCTAATGGAGSRTEGGGP